MQPSLPDMTGLPAWPHVSRGGRPLLYRIDRLQSVITSLHAEVAPSFVRNIPKSERQSCIVGKCNIFQIMVTLECHGSFCGFQNTNDKIRFIGNMATVDVTGLSTRVT